jgi:Fe-S-cluster-containing hydrogenase component 2
VKLLAVHEKCSGCGTCRLACAIENFREVNPSRAFLRIEGRFPAPGDYRVHLCDQCGECAANCPEEAIHSENGVFVVDTDSCTGCLLCVEVCPQGVMFEQAGSKVPAKCVLCGECARVCPRNAIRLTGHADREVA